MGHKYFANYIMSFC